MYSLLTQERTYNPYYVLVGQHLAHDHPGMRVTMQFALWDYFREIGERRVGGAKMVADDDDDALDSAAVAASEQALADAESTRKLVHLARAYAYWFARGGLSLSALKTVDFTSLQPAGTLFLQHLLMHVLLLTQVKSPMLTRKSRAALAQPPQPAQRDALERLFVKGTVGQPSLAQGLLVFLQMHLQRGDLVALLGDEDDGVLGRLVWAVGVAHETLSVGAQAADAAMDASP